MIKYRNKYRVEGNICYIDCFNKDGNLTGSIIIDSVDIPLVNFYQWHVEKSRTNLSYAQASYKGKTIRMHRLICPSQEQVDHINHNGLDNRKCNLRKCNNQQNNCNKKQKENAGIRFNPKCGTYYVRIMVHKKEISLGHFNNLSDAREARKQGEIKYFGDFRNV